MRLEQIESPNDVPKLLQTIESGRILYAKNAGEPLSDDKVHTALMRTVPLNRQQGQALLLHHNVNFLPLLSRHRSLNGYPRLLMRTISTSLQMATTTPPEGPRAGRRF